VDAGEWTFLLCAACQLALAALCFARGVRAPRSPVALPLAFLCLTTFGWCTMSLAGLLAGPEPWGPLDECLSALAPPFALDLAVTFVGARRSQRRVVIASYAIFSALALASLAGIASPAVAVWTGSSLYAASSLAALVPAMVFIFVLLTRHLLTATDPGEKSRARLMLAGFIVYAAPATSDRAIGLGLSLPHIAPLGALLSAFLLATAVFRFRLFDRDLSANTALSAIGLVAAAIAVYVLCFTMLGGSKAAATFGAIVVATALGAAVYEASAAATARRAHIERLVALGRFSSQMAHDFKNPLASVKGSLQFLQEERRRGRSLDDHQEFLTLMLDQVGRLERIADDYERLGRVEPVRHAIELNRLVEKVVALQPFATQSEIAIHVELAAALPPCQVDADLVSRALENLIRNAFEAMPSGGKLTVRTGLGAGGASDPVVLSVEDEGVGMDPRQAERAFDEFYTTKPTGRGLGLAFVRRVARAHGGEASLRSQVGVGTIVEMRLPLAVRG
jgi:two-component system sensor histidine kinase HydH